jgi:hypothetical protein
MWSLPIQRLNSEKSNGWDRSPDEIVPGRRERISEESRQILLAACHAATMDGFLLISVLVPAKVNEKGFALIDESRQGASFSNIADGDLASLLLWAAERLKGRR